MGTSSNRRLSTRLPPAFEPAINPPLKMRAVIAVLVLVVAMATVTDLSYGAPNSPRMKRDDEWVYESCVNICRASKLGCAKTVFLGLWCYFWDCEDICSQ